MLPVFSKAFERDIFEYQSSRPVTAMTEGRRKADSSKDHMDNLTKSFQSNTQIFMHNFTNIVAWKTREINKYISPEDDKKMFSILPYQVIPMKSTAPEVPDFNPQQFKTIRLPMSNKKSPNK
jgi:hypothetical protein